jgi:hypothetical protein
MCYSCNCNHSTASSGGDGVFVALILGVVAIVKAAWWLTTRIAVPLAALTSVMAYRWTTGLPLLPDRTHKTPPMFNRGVRAAGRDVVTAIVIGTLLNPLLTALVTVTIVGSAVTTVAVVRLRADRARKPRRVTVTTGAPTRLRRPRYALTAERADTTWTEHSVRETGRAA